MTPSPPSRTRRLGALLAAAVVAGSALGASPAVAVDAAPDASRPAVSAPARTAASTAADPNADGYDSFIVTYKETASVSRPKGRALAWGKAAKEAGVSVKELRETALGSHVIATDEKLSPSASAAFMADLKASSLVEAVEPNAIMTASGLTPADPYYGQQWGFTGVNGMRVPGAWDSTTGTGSIVAVIDTGITSHADLNANVVAGYDFISNTTSSRDGNGRDANPADEGDWYLAGECGDPNPSNSSWHGTHVAGTVAAAANTVGVVGVAPNAKIQPVRVLGKCGGSLADIADAIVWSAGGSVPGAPLNATPADVINMSLGGSGTCGTTYQNAINAAVGRGVPVVVAAGNENQPAANARPANCQNTITVAASDSSGRRSSFSNYGSAVDVTAPGSSIISTVNTGTTRPSGAGYASYNGTSMATPHVAGLTALMLTKQPGLTPAQVESTLKSTARAMPVTCSEGCGAGLADATAAVAAVGGTAPTDPTAPVEPAPAPSGNLLVNPGFESGATGWSGTGRSRYESVSPHSGIYHGVLNNLGYANTATLSQTVAVPAGTTTTLSYWVRVDSAETSSSTAYDKLSVQVRDGAYGTYTLKTHSNMEKGRGWVQHTVDVSRFAGRTVTLQFRGVEDSSAWTAFSLDDLALSAK